MIQCPKLPLEQGTFVFDIRISFFEFVSDFEFSIMRARCVHVATEDSKSSIREVTMNQQLDGQRILVFVGEIYEDLDLWYPKLRLLEAGAEVVVAGPEAQQEYAGKHGYPCVSDVAIRDVRASEFDGLVVPGGFMPDKLRRDADVLEIVRQFDAAGKLIAAVCHGGWIPISAGVYRGVEVTGSPGIKDDLVNAGAIWKDEPVVVDRHFVSSRKPDDLHDFFRGILGVLRTSENS